MPLLQHVGKICNPEVKIGDNVLLGQRIATVQAHVFSPVHSSVSGKVASIQDWPHPSLGRCKAIVVENDKQDRPASTLSRSAEQINKLSADEIRNIVFEAGIVGLGGASFPSHIKLAPPSPVDTLIVNAAECEPYLTGDYRLMLEKTREILLGIELASRCLSVKNVFIAIEDNKPLAIKAFETIGQSRCVIRVLKSMYPQGGEKQLIKNVLGKELTRGKLPFNIGVVVHNVATLYAIYEAVYLNKPLYERVVTVTGSCVSNPKNLLVRLGTPIKELIEHCGPLREEPQKIIIGGPMMGIAQFDDQSPVIKSTTGIILLGRKESAMVREQPCIRCGACVRECPVYLMPTLINLASQKSLWPQTKKYGALDCIECGICSYVCPSAINLVQSIRRAKLEAIK